jgi:hypothetical protein
MYKTTENFHKIESVFDKKRMQIHHDLTRVTLDDIRAKVEACAKKLLCLFDSAMYVI